MNNPKFIFSDLDSTITNCQHRVHFALDKKWDEFNALCHLDEPNRDVTEFLSIASEHCNVGIATGRGERYREATEAWLKKHNIWFDVLLMRPDQDRLSSGDLKRRMLEEHFGSKQLVLENVLIFLEDRDNDTHVLRNYGLNVWQCRPNSF